MQLKKSIALVLIASITACSTSPNVNTKSAQESVDSKTFQGERVSHFMLTEDGKTLVVLGSKHHFSFPIDDNIRDLLQWESRKHLMASFYDAESLDAVNVNVKYRLMVYKNKPEEVSFLKAHKFKYNSTTGYYVLNGKLSGNYYTTHGTDIDISKFDKFNRDYRLFYKGEKIPVAKHKTSLTETGGSLLFLGAALVIIPLMAITSPFTSDYKGAW
ncbi:hypothetical protein MTYP_01500 [Methylophilaceae bacterium]|nr:hypothetical protein MTYP_01500 [Methylophilaceae bacterium]